MPANTSPLTHIAGADVLIGGRRLRQRCAWCGAILLDYDLTMVAVAVQPGEDTESPATWPVTRLVRVDGNLSTLLEETDELPEDCCGKVDDEVTR